MAKAIPTLLLFISISFAIILYQYPSQNLSSAIGLYNYKEVSNYIINVCKEFEISKFYPIEIYETESLYEFNKITNEEYCIGGIYSDNYIVLQPFKILKEKGLLAEIVAHELIHYILHTKYSLPKWMEEGYIEYILNDKLESLKGYHKDYLERFLREIIDEQKSIKDIFNNYRR